MNRQDGQVRRDLRRAPYPTAVLGAIRNIGAPGPWLTAGPFGGRLETPDFEEGRVVEIAELCVFNAAGWVGFGIGGPHQRALQNEQIVIWQALDRFFPQVDCAYLESVKCGCDSVYGHPCIITIGHWGDLTVTKFAHLDLFGGNWRIRDGELDDQGWPLNRTMVAIVMCEREGRKYPVMMTFDPATGALSQCGPHVTLTGDARRQLVGYLFEQALGPHGLGWLG